MTNRFSPLTSRRTLVGGLIALGASPGRLVAAPAGDRLIAGTYASEGGPGLVQLQARDEGWATGTAHPAIKNASFGVASPLHRLRYLLEEQTSGTMSVYTPSFERLGTVSTGGADPCHAALSPDHRMVAVANYSSGSVALWSLNPATGLPIGQAQMVTHQGSGPDTQRQTGPHAHWVGFTNQGATLHAVDLGADAIFAHRIDRGTGRVTDTIMAYRAEAGSGPRHLARHPRLPIAYLVAELANTVTVLRASQDGTFRRQATHSTLPNGFSGESSSAHISLNRSGKRLYVSNRGHDSIAVYAVEKDGGLQLMQHVSCGGHWPRFFLLREDRREMLVANERSGSVARLPLRRDGTLRTATGQTQLPGVVFLGS